MNGWMDVLPCEEKAKIFCHLPYKTKVNTPVCYEGDGHGCWLNYCSDLAPHECKSNCGAPRCTKWYVISLSSTHYWCWSFMKFVDINSRISEHLRFNYGKKGERRNCLNVLDSRRCCDNHLILLHLCASERDMINLCLLIFCQKCTSFPQWVLFLYEQTVIRAGKPSRGAGRERESERVSGWNHLCVCDAASAFQRERAGRLHWGDNSKLIEGCGGVGACDWFSVILWCHWDHSSFLSNSRQSAKLLKSLCSTVYLASTALAWIHSNIYNCMLENHNVDLNRAFLSLQISKLIKQNATFNYVI